MLVWQRLGSLLRFSDAVAAFNLPTFIRRPYRGCCRWNFDDIFGVRKLDPCPRFSHLVTDGRTDEHTMTASTALA